MGAADLAVPRRCAPRNLMFVRLRVSSTNLDWVRDGVDWYTSYQVPVVLDVDGLLYG